MQAVLTADRGHRYVQPRRAAVVPIVPAVAGSSLFAKLHDSAARKRAAAWRGRDSRSARRPRRGRTPRPPRVRDRRRSRAGAALRRSHRSPPTAGKPWDLGLADGLELRNGWKQVWASALPVALVWAYPTISDLATAPVNEWTTRHLRLRRRFPDTEPELSEEEMDCRSG